MLAASKRLLRIIYWSTRYLLTYHSMNYLKPPSMQEEMAFMRMGKGASKELTCPECGGTYWSFSKTPDPFCPKIVCYAKYHRRKGGVNAKETQGANNTTTT